MTSQPQVLPSQQPQPSWDTIYHTPPKAKTPYDPSDALDDLPGISYALELFLASHMVESEEYCHKNDETKERLYFATGYGLIQCVKGLMSYADEDLLSAINHTKHGNYIANLHRKKAGFLGSIGLGGSSTQFIKSMTDVERHAELVYAESLFEKALLGIVYSGDWLAFIKEALNMRTTIGIYQHLGAFLDEVDAEYAASLSSATSTTSSPSAYTSNISAASSLSSLPPTTTTSSTSTTTTSTSASKPTGTSSQNHIEDPSIDAHFRSGVHLGVGMCNIILSLIPGRLATLVELFGYKGERRLGLDFLMRAGQWDRNNEEPGVGTRGEGVRRSICDMALLIFHLVLSSFTVEGVDIMVARRVLDWNLKRYPNGVFFLFGAGRLALHTSQPRKAIVYYARAMAAQGQYRNLDHISFWEVAVARLALWEVGEEVPGESKTGVLTTETKDKAGGEGKTATDEDEDEEWMKVEGEKVGGSAACWRVLEQEATWSKAIYSYGLAACLLENWDTDIESEEGRKQKTKRMKDAAELMARVPNLRQKIAGKSIPLEKFVARKARKFASQGKRLLLPALEVAYVFQAIAHAPRSVVAKKMLPLVQKVLAHLAIYGTGTGLDSIDETSTVSDVSRSVNGNEIDDIDIGETPKTAWLAPPPEKGDKRKKFSLKQPPPSPLSLKPPPSPFTPLSGGKSPMTSKSFMSGIATWGKDKRRHGNDINDDENNVQVKKLGEAKYEGGEGEYWDDLCLARFLEGVCLRFVAYPDPDAVLDPEEVVDMPQTVAAKAAEDAFRAVFEYGPKIELDHHLVYHAHYELGRLLACRGDVDAAKAEFELVLSGKYLEVGPSGRKGRYSMENALHIRTHAALDALQNNQ